MENDKIIQICSIDIGSKNFAFYIEEFNASKLERINNISKDERYNSNGTLTDLMDVLLKEVFVNGKTILHINEDLTKNTDKDKYLDQQIYYNMIDHLEKYKEYLDKCSYFVIEQQLKRNTKAMKLGQHCASYFMIKYGKTKPLIEFPAYYKTTILGAIKTFDKQYKNGNIKWKTLGDKERKKWAISKVFDILSIRGEENALNNIKTKKKQCDLADTNCQLQAFKYLYFVDKLRL